MERIGGKKAKKDCSNEGRPRNGGEVQTDNLCGRKEWDFSCPHKARTEGNWFLRGRNRGVAAITSTRVGRPSNRRMKHYERHKKNARGCSPERSIERKKKIWPLSRRLDSSATKPRPKAELLRDYEQPPYAAEGEFSRDSLLVRKGAFARLPKNILPLWGGT